LKEENSKKKEDEEKARLKEERIKNKMLQKLGIENVQSRFRSEMAQTAKTSDEDTHIKRSASMAKAKKDTRGKLYNTTYGQNLGTPKNSIRNRLTEVKELDEKVNEDKKTRVEANERIRKKQADYLKSLADKKRQGNEKEEEERKRQEQMRLNLRAKVKGMLDNVERKPKEVTNVEDEEDKEQRKMNPDDIQSFLERNTGKKKVFTNITDFDMWKKKQRIDYDTKVYICTGGYGTIRKSLQSRGWVENKDPKSP
jgi:hypothetical protein